MTDMDIWDGDWVLFSHNAATGQTMWFNPKEDMMKTTYAVDPLIDANKADRQDAAGHGWGDGQRVASIPMNVYHDKLAEAVAQGDKRYLQRFLNDGENAAWRTKEGQV